MTSYETASNSFTSVMSCNYGDGSAGSTTVSGEIEGNSLDVTMTMECEDPQMGEVRMVLNLQSERVGDCGAEG